MNTKSRVLSVDKLMGFQAMVVVLLLLAFGCSQSEPDDASRKQAEVTRDSSAESFPDFQVPDIIQSSVSFYGWIGDTAVLAEEIYTEDGESHAEYYFLRPGEGEMEPLERNDSTIQSLAAVASGTDVAPLHGMDPKEPFIELYLDYDSTALAAVQAGLDTVEPGDDLPEPVGGLVGVIWHRPDIGIDTLWLDSVYVGPYYGEAAVEYHQPELTYAELSPSRRSLMAALWLNDYIEHFVFDLTRLRE